jgi:hypothetical protein
VKCPVVHFRNLDPASFIKAKNVATLALTSLMKLSPQQQVTLIVRTATEAVRQKLLREELEPALEFIGTHIHLQDPQRLQLDQKMQALAHKDPRFTHMKQALNPFVQLGIYRGEVAMVLRQLERKFPGLASKLSAKIRNLGEENLLAFGEALLFMNTPKECREWVNARA